MILTQNMIANAIIWIVQIISVASILSQVFLNYKVKSTNGLSNTYILIYLSGYIIHLLYVFCLDLPTAYKIMGPLSALLVLILAFQRFFYNKHKVERRLIRLYCVNFFIIFLLIVLAINFPNKIGHLAGWISVAIWTIYQLPQVFKIYSKKSIVGFSFAFVSLSGFQNLLEFIAGLSLGLLIQTIFVSLRGLAFYAIFCFQFLMYKKKPKSIIQSERTKQVLAYVFSPKKKEANLLTVNHAFLHKYFLRNIQKKILKPKNL